MQYMTMIIIYQGQMVNKLHVIDYEVRLYLREIFIMTLHKLKKV